MSLTLVPIYLGSQPDLIDLLTERLGHVLAQRIRVRRPWFEPELSYDPSRGQYSSTLLLSQLLSEPEPVAEPDRANPLPGLPGGDRVLGVASVDLFIPVLTYVFGEAQLGGRAAVVSLHRLRSEAYGLPPDPALLRTRLVKEAVHELGHTFGLVHCRQSDCVMHSSTYVEEIDLKGADFCDQCASAVFDGQRDER
jgi:archaemetzincin